MKDNVRQYLRTHYKGISIATLMLASIIASAFLPHSLHRFVMPGLLVALMAYVGWVKTHMPVRKLEAPAYTLTIHEQFQRTRALLLRLMLPLLGIWILFVLQFWPAPLNAVERQAIAIAGGVAIAMLASACVGKRMRCPRCGSNFRKQRIEKLGRWTLDTRGTEELWHSCPQCSVDFDEPWAI